MTEPTEPVAEPATPAESADSPFRFGYTVGLKEDGKLVFDLIGSPSPGVIQLLGLQELAARQVEAIVQETMNTGDAITLKALSTIFEKLLEMQAAAEPNEAQPNE